MATYLIHEDNLPRLERKLKPIFNKCKKYGIEFSYREVREEYREVETESHEKFLTRFVEVEVSGNASIAGWTLVAKLERVGDANLIRKFDDTKELPKNYFTEPLWCDHCDSNHGLRYAYIVYNEETEEFKSVGSSCLKAYTGSLSAEIVASYISCFDAAEVEVNREVNFGYAIKHFEIKKILPYFCKATREDGFHSTADYLNSTRRAGEIMYQTNESVDEADRKCTEACLDWISEQDSDSEYIHNLKVICTNEYCRSRDLGLLASLPNSYHLDMAKRRREEKLAAKKAKGAQSQYVANEGDKIEVKTNDFVCVTCWDTQYGTTYLFKFHDENGNEFIWYASRGFANPERVNKVIGKVKLHQEYQGVKETVLTRCKVEYSEEEDVEVVKTTASEEAFNNWYNDT